MTIQKLKRALDILCADGNKSDEMSAKHDELFLGGPRPEALSEMEIKELKELGVAWDVSYDCWHTFV